MSWGIASDYEASMGNKYNVGEAGEITSVEVYSKKDGNSTGRKVVLDIYNKDRQLVGSSEAFLFSPDAWLKVPLPNILYSETFYAMVHWLEEPGLSHRLGFDQTGPNANAGLNYYIQDGTWYANFHSLSNPPQDPGVLMIRVNAIISGKLVTYGNMIDYKVYRLKEGESEDFWTLLANKVSELIYTDTEWKTLSPGIYQWAVKANYISGSSEPMLTNSLEKEIKIKEYDLTDIQIYPNPTTGKLTIDNEQLTIIGVEIFDVYGKKLFLQKAESRMQKANSPPFMEGWQPQADGVVIDISNFSSGIYFVKIETENGTITKKIIKN